VKVYHAAGINPGMKEELRTDSKEIVKGRLSCCFTLQALSVDKGRRLQNAKISIIIRGVI
jgi:hypothetical protein